ncbi:GNAT family N-acetyltransferase [Longimicrobium sp.]|uniref:GNAT family N-acetyltransferase n=1 Tax=Longimicrobium sp. TaxID=2029185 RepID=UPI003B3A24D3
MTNEGAARFEKNVPGPFYGTGDCMACGAPELEAPHLLAPLEGDNYHTYFVRQPATPDEVEQACRALESCCVAALRYGGRDPLIIQRLGNDPEFCDHLLPGPPVPRPQWRDAKAPAATITITGAALTDDVSRTLIQELNAELSGMYPEPGANHFGLHPDEVQPGRGAFLVVHRDGTPLGCGALRRLDDETGELKRMYVAPAARGLGLGRRLVDALEAEARALGLRRLVLETGTRQEAAIALYRATGFDIIPLYGEYLNSPETSVCMGKEIPAHEP